MGGRRGGALGVAGRKETSVALLCKGSCWCGAHFCHWLAVTSFCLGLQLARVAALTLAQCAKPGAGEAIQVTAGSLGAQAEKVTGF